MNGRERIQAVLKGQWPDKRPIMLHNFMLATREAGMKMKDYYSNGKNAAKVHIQSVEKYKLDGILLDIDTALLAHAVGVPVDFPEDDPARVHKPKLTSLEQVKNLKPVNIKNDPRINVALEAARELKKYFKEEIFIRGNCDQAPFSLASMMRTPADWMMDLMMDTENSFKLLDYCNDVCCQFIKLMAAEGVHMISNGDSPAGPEMIAPEMFRQFALPYEKKLVDYAHSFKLPYMNHICGNTDLILADMITTGLDAIEIDYKTNIKKVHDLYKDKVVLSGTIDPSGVIALGTTEMVEKKAREILDLYKDSPRLIMNAGCAIPPNTPEANIRKLVEVTRSY
jgi:MtaA/CmuA family methyltransferase